MNPEQQRATLTLALLAAFADGEKHARERKAIHQIAESLSKQAGTPDLISLHQDVLLRRASLEGAAGQLREAEHRQLAYEMALCVCEADGKLSEAERRFLDNLKTLLALDGPNVDLIEGETDAMLDLGETDAPAAPPARVSEAELDQSILRYSLLNGALELLPQAWASMAIIPLQIKMVHGIGQAHGVALDQGHIKEFIAAAGVGLTSQYLEQFGRKLLGGLLGKMGGAATGMAFSFATTYALGQVARRYYAGGRRMDVALLKSTFQNLIGPARQLQAQYLPEMQQQARNLDLNQVMTLARGG